MIAFILGYLFVLSIPLMIVMAFIGAALSMIPYMIKYGFIAMIVIAVVGIPLIKVIDAAQENPIITKIIAVAIGLSLAGATAWYWMPAGDIFAFTKDAVAMNIRHSGLSDFDDKQSVLCEDRDVVQQAVDGIADLVYKPARTGIKGIADNETTYHLEMKDKDGNSIGTISVLGDKYVTITDENGKAKTYVPYFYGKDGNKISVSGVIEQQYLSATGKSVEKIWSDFRTAVYNGFSFDDEKITFTMPAEPEGEYYSFGIKIDLVVSVNGKRGFVNVLEIKETEKVPGGQVYQFDMPKEKLMFIKVNLSTDKRSRPMEIKDIPEKYKYSGK